MKSNWYESLKVLMLSLMFASGAVVVTGCEDGAFENAGENIDDAGDELGDELDQAGDEIDEEF